MTDKAKGIRIATRCASVDDFVKAFQRFVEKDTMFVATTNTRPAGLEAAFCVQLADGAAVLSGTCEVLEAFTVESSPFKVPGVKLRLVRLSPSTRPVFERLVAAREAQKLTMPPPVVARGSQPAIPGPAAQPPKVVAIGVPTAPPSRASVPAIPAISRPTPIPAAIKPPPVGAKPADKAADAKPADKSADAKPADKSAEAKPADAKPADAKPADAERGDASPPDAKPAVAKHADAAPVAAKVPGADAPSLSPSPSPSPSLSPSAAAPTPALPKRSSSPALESPVPDVPKASSTASAPSVAAATASPSAASPATAAASSGVAEATDSASATPPSETRTPGSPFILPANPLMDLTDESLEGYVDCTLYEETATFFLENTDVPPDDVDGDPVAPPPAVTPAAAVRPVSSPALRVPASSPAIAVPPADTGPAAEPTPAGAPAAATPAAHAEATGYAHAAYADPIPQHVSQQSATSVDASSAEPAYAPPPDAEPQYAEPQYAPAPYAEPAYAQPTYPEPMSYAPSVLVDPGVTSSEASAVAATAVPSLHVDDDRTTPVMRDRPISEPSYLRSSALAAEPAAAPSLLSRIPSRAVWIAAGVAAIALAVVVFRSGEDVPKAKAASPTAATAAKTKATPAADSNRATAARPSDEVVAATAPTPAKVETPASAAVDTEAENAATDKATDEAGAGDDAGDETASADPSVTLGDVPVIGDGPCRIEVLPRPLEAVVYLDGKRIATGAATIQTACARHEVELKHPRYAAFKRVVTPTEGKAASVDVQMQRPTHTVLFFSQPPGAQVFVDGKRVGTTPVTTKVAGFSGVQVDIKKLGFATVSKRLYSKKPTETFTTRLTKW